MLREVPGVNSLILQAQLAAWPLSAVKSASRCQGLPRSRSRLFEGTGFCAFALLRFPPSPSYRFPGKLAVCIFVLMSASDGPVLTFGDRRYAIQDLPDTAKAAIQNLQWADAQIRHHEEALRVSTYARQAMVQELTTILATVPALP